MTSKERAAMQQALEALVYHTEQTRPIHSTNEAITALREALASRCQTTTTEQAEQEPVAWMSENGLVITDKGAANVWIENGFAVEPLYKATPPPSQKPIAWWNGAYDITMNSFEAREDWTPLYAAPVRTKDLSDDEILDVALSIEIEFSKDTDKFVQQLEDIEVFARAIIEKFKEKNK